MSSPWKMEEILTSNAYGQKAASSLRHAVVRAINNGVRHSVALAEHSGEAGRSVFLAPNRTEHYDVFEQERFGLQLLDKAKIVPNEIIPLVAFIAPTALERESLAWWSAREKVEFARFQPEVPQQIGAGDVSSVEDSTLWPHPILVGFYRRRVLVEGQEARESGVFEAKSHAPCSAKPFNTSEHRHLKGDV